MSDFSRMALAVKMKEEEKSYRDFLIYENKLFDDRMRKKMEEYEKQVDKEIKEQINSVDKHIEQGDDYIVKYGEDALGRRRPLTKRDLMEIDEKQENNRMKYDEQKADQVSNLLEEVKTCRTLLNHLEGIVEAKEPCGIRVEGHSLYGIGKYSGDPHFVHPLYNAVGVYQREVLDKLKEMGLSLEVSK